MKGVSSFVVTDIQVSVGVSSGGGGNCTRVPVYVTVCPKCGYDTPVSGSSEMDREDAALHELVGTWHRLTPDVRAAIMQLVRGKG
jgi:hypothetical protein